MNPAVPRPCPEPHQRDCNSVHPNWRGATGRLDISLQWTVPASACGELLMDGPIPSSPVEFLGTRGSSCRPDQAAHPDGHPGAVRAGVICGADGFVALALFGRLNEKWLRTFPGCRTGSPRTTCRGRSSHGWMRPGSLANGTIVNGDPCLTNNTVAAAAGPVARVGIANKRLPVAWNKDWPGPTGGPRPKPVGMQSPWEPPTLVIRVAEVARRYRSRGRSSVPKTLLASSLQVLRLHWHAVLLPFRPSSRMGSDSLESPTLNVEWVVLFGPLFAEAGIPLRSVHLEE